MHRREIRNLVKRLERLNKRYSQLLNEKNELEKALRACGKKAQRVFENNGESDE